MGRPTRVLMVCLGNICRSPTAEAALVEAAADAGVDVEVDSAGTAAYHVGEPPDPRMLAAAADAGLALTSIGRQVDEGDFEHFDVLVAMDAANRRDLLARAPSPAAAAALARKVVLLRDYAGEPGQDVPDPYHGGPEGFEEVVRIVRAGAVGLVAAIAAGDPLRLPA